MGSVFDSYSPFIKEFIYRRGWERLHEMQVAASRVIFETEDNLLLTSSTASGKTEAAFFPVLSEIYEDIDNIKGFAVLYIAPLKSLINDQFNRITELTEEAGIPVYHWHGDVASSHKSRALLHPSGVLQITPESVESMLIRRSGDLNSLLGDLRYVIIDEIHTMTGTDRGNQVLCQLKRISDKTGRFPRRIGLSATVGDIESAARWLGAGSGRSTSAPEPGGNKIKWRLGMEHFYINGDGISDDKRRLAEIANGVSEPTEEDAIEKPYEDTFSLDPGFEYVYDCVKDKKALVFSNSREETEYVTATLRQIASKRGEEDIFLIHHGNLSASIREDAEIKMKDDESHVVTCATTTMELGIDIGRLERIIQMGSPHSVKSFLQRLGRSGRRESPPEMMMVYREESALPNAPLPQLIPWELLRGIAIVQLYVEERFIEPPFRIELPFSLLFHQTMSVLASRGAMEPPSLASTVLSFPPFENVTADDYKTLLVSMINEDYLEMTDEGELIIGLRGERMISSFKFFAVFKDSEDFTVRCGSDEIGTISSAPPPGDRFALAGRVWEVEECDAARRLIYVKAVEGKMEIAWPGDFGEIHTKILKRMKQVLCEDVEYPYLKEGALKRLRAARAVARNTGVTQKDVISTGGSTYVCFPWLGTRSFRTMRRFIGKNGGKFGVSGMEFEGCNYISFKLKNGTGDELFDYLADVAAKGIDLNILVGENEAPAFGKFDPMVPPELLRKAYIRDRLRADEVYDVLMNRKNRSKG